MSRDCLKDGPAATDTNVSSAKDLAASDRWKDVPGALWREARAAAWRLLILDYDGTLAPFHVERSRAVPSGRVLGLLAELARSARTRVAIVSGRPIEELERLLGPLPATLVGEHGWETKAPGEPIVRHPLPDPARAALEHAAEWMAGRVPAGRLERKRTGVVLHTRGLDASEAAELEGVARRLWEELARGADLRLTEVNGGLELRAQGRDKGMATLALLSASPPGSVTVYVGDDRTDEDAFRVLRDDEGFAIRIGPEDPSSAARGRLDRQDDVDAFLARWLAVVETPGPAAESR
jgi:trehalose-phosphatase